MSADFYEGLRVRVACPSPRHRHTLGWEGSLAKKAKGGYWWVKFLSGKGLYHASELEPAHLLAGEGARG